SCLEAIAIRHDPPRSALAETPDDQHRSGTDLTVGAPGVLGAVSGPLATTPSDRSVPQRRDRPRISRRPGAPVQGHCCVTRPARVWGDGRDVPMGLARTARADVSEPPPRSYSWRASLPAGVRPGSFRGCHSAVVRRYDPA